MGIPEVVVQEEVAVDEARSSVAPAREPEGAMDASEAPSCMTALFARSIEEQIVPI